MKLHQPTPEVFHECFTWKCSLRLEEEILKQSWSFAPLRVYTIRQTLGGADSLPETNSSSPTEFWPGPKRNFESSNIFQHSIFRFELLVAGRVFPFLNGIPGCPTSQDFDKISQISNGLVVSTLGKSSPCLDLWPRNGDFICVFLRKLWKSTKPHQLTIKRTN